MTNYYETDPVWGAVSNAVITQAALGETAYGWGDHATKGYADSNLVEATYLNKTGDLMTGALHMNVGVASNIVIGSDGEHIIIGNRAAAVGGTNRIAIGRQVTNTVDESVRLRGDLYLDGGTTVLTRPAFGAGPFEQLLPIGSLENVVYVAPNGTSSGPGTIDRPFDTPQRGYNRAATLYTNTPAAVVIAAGYYAGATLTMTEGNIHVIGHGRAEIDDLNVNAPAEFIRGKQRIENLVVRTRTTVQNTATDVKFFNCRFTGEGLIINGSGIEVHNCFASNDGAVSGVAVTIGLGVALTDVALYHSSFYNSGLNPTLRVEENVSNFQVKGCQIVNAGGGACIEDLEPGPISPLHLYTHNYIRGTAPAIDSEEAVQDLGGGHTIAFTHNKVLGHVGLNGNEQYYANNTVYGIINNVGGNGLPGWSQAGQGTGADAAGNIEHEDSFPDLPAAWLD